MGTERGEVHKHQGKTMGELELDVNIEENPDQQPDDGADDESAEVHEDPDESDDFDEDEGLGEQRRTRRMLPSATRNDIYDYFRLAIAAKKPPTAALCRQYIEEHSSELEWTRVKAIVNSRIQVLRNKE